MDKKQLQGILWILLSSAGYAMVAIFGKLLFHYHLDSSFMMVCRFFGASCFFWICILWQRKQLPSWKQILCLFSLGLIGDALQVCLFLISIKEVGASIATILLYTYSIFVIILQTFIFKEKLTFFNIGKILLAFLGIFLITSPFDQSLPNFLGILTGLGAAFCCALYISLGSRWTKSLDTFTSSAFLSSGAFGSFLIYALKQKSMHVPSSSIEWTLILAFIFIATVIPLISFVKGMKLLGPTKTSFVFAAEPLLATLFACLFFSETMTLMKILGSSLIFTGILMNQKEKQPTEEIA